MIYIAIFGVVMLVVLGGAAMAIYEAGRNMEE